MRRDLLRRWAPTSVVLLVAILAGLSAGTSWLVAHHMKSDARAISQLYSGVFAGLNDPRPSAETDALLSLGRMVSQQGLILIVTDGTGRVTAAANLPFKPDGLSDPRIRALATRLDQDNPPVTTELIGSVHFGPIPAEHQLVRLAALQGLIILVMVLVAWFAYRNAMAANRDRLWVAMAREAAHQMGTPLTSLQGWVEQARGGTLAPAAFADHLEADAERLDRVARRFERIGRPATRSPLGLGALASRVAEYFRPRLPHRANPIQIQVVAAGPGPHVLGDPILLEWVLESLVKNAIDALQGRAGTITLEAGMSGDQATLRVKDDGPGVSRELRRSLFEPGVTSKEGGWGIGLALARRVVEDSHGGTIDLEATEQGASFVLRMPHHAAESGEWATTGRTDG
ncbi:MAG: HAMP domain-containing sensor histidine kinase [Gemmatimonadales bacterium]